MLRIISFVVCIASAFTSLGFMFYTGRYNKSVLLMLMFTGWVLAPFAALLLSYRFTKQLRATAPLYYMALVVSAVSILFYNGFIQVPDVRPAFVYLVCPLASLVLIAVIYWTKLRKKINP